MSSVSDPTGVDWDRVDALTEFLQESCADELGDLYAGYPDDKTSIYIEWAHLWEFDSDIAYDYLDAHDKIQDSLHRAFLELDHPTPRTTWDHVAFRVTDRRGMLDRVKVGELKADHVGQFVALRCQLGQVTARMNRLSEAAFECTRCGTLERISQPFVGFQEPHECPGCERSGPFTINFDRSELTDQRKVLLEEPPEEQVNGSGVDITAYALGELANLGDGNGLVDRAGARITVLGTVEIDDTDLTNGSSDPVAESYFLPEAFIFDDGPDDEIDIEEHRAAVEEWAARDDAIDVFRRNIDPGLTLTDDWDTATEMATAYLFASPRLEEGETVRGDIHMLMVSDPGMRKSIFAEQVNEIAPQSTLRQATGMASDVGLTAAASQDDFGDGGWSLKPGALPRANGGHLVLDEIDKGPDGLGGIHDALEGAQQLKVDKAGIQATLATRVGLLALGNPIDGRFTEHESIPEQIGLDPALMSRFDLIITMRDSTDEEMDSQIATDVLDSIDESLALEYGALDREDANKSIRELPDKVMTAWIAIAREEVDPQITPAAKERLKEFYVDTRQLNQGQDTNTPPVTARKLVAGYRLASAFARCELSDTIEPHHAERAIGVSRSVVSENWDGEQFDADRTTEGANQTNSQQSRIERVKNVLRNGDDLTEEEIAEEANLPLEKTEHYIQKLKDKGIVYEPQTGVLRWA